MLLVLLLVGVACVHDMPHNWGRRRIQHTQSFKRQHSQSACHNKLQSSPTGGTAYPLPTNRHLGHRNAVLLHNSFWNKAAC